MKALIVCMALSTIAQVQPQDKMKVVEKNNMKVTWEIQNELIHFQMEAPTNGWVAIGFNETPSLAGTYLVMGRIRNGHAEVVEHYTNKPGSYQPIGDYGVSSQVTSISGDEVENKTTLRFSIPIEKASRYHKKLSPQTTWTLLLAYSVDDDFQHHSIMRTSMEVVI